MPDDGFVVDVVGGVLVVVAPEEIDITNAEALRSALLKAAASGPGPLVVDMTRTQFCDSSGPHVLFAAHERAQAEGREVLLVIPSAVVLRVFALIGVDRMIPNFTSLAEALARPAGVANGRSVARWASGRFRMCSGNHDAEPHQATSGYRPWAEATRQRPRSASI
jgi:anti-sigma B factor antagonist